MFFQDILKNTPDKFVDKKETEEALENISKIATFMNDGKKNSEISKIIKDLSKLIGEKYIDEINNKKFKKQGEIEITYPKCEKHSELFEAYCFQNMLILLDLKEKKTVKRSVYFIYFACTNLIPCQNVTEIKLETLNEGENRLIYLKFKEESKRVEWEKLFNECIENEKNSLPNFGFNSKF
jgi:hypothetical protein